MATEGTKSTLGGLQFIQNALARQQQSARAEALQTVRDLSAEAGDAEAAAAADALATSAGTSAPAGRRAFGGSSSRAAPLSASTTGGAMATQLHRGEQSTQVRRAPSLFSERAPRPCRSRARPPPPLRLCAQSLLRWLTPCSAITPPPPALVELEEASDARAASVMGAPACLEPCESMCISACELRRLGAVDARSGAVKRRKTY